MTYEYEADNEDELTIRVGDVVEIVNKDVDGQDGWWEVCVCVCVCVLYRDIVPLCIGYLSKVFLVLQP